MSLEVGADELLRFRTFKTRSYYYTFKQCSIPLSYVLRNIKPCNATLWWSILWRYANKICSVCAQGTFHEHLNVIILQTELNRCPYILRYWRVCIHSSSNRGVLWLARENCKYKIYFLLGHEIPSMAHE